MIYQNIIALLVGPLTFNFILIFTNKPLNLINLFKKIINNKNIKKADNRQIKEASVTNGFCNCPPNTVSVHQNCYNTTCADFLVRYGCTKHGTCYKGKCVCDQGFGGAVCQSKLAPNSCQHVDCKNGGK
jgi:hypothetical protein